MKKDTIPLTYTEKFGIDYHGNTVLLIAFSDARTKDYEKVIEKYGIKDLLYFIPSHPYKSSTIFEFSLLYTFLDISRQQIINVFENDLNRYVRFL